VQSERTALIEREPLARIRRERPSGAGRRPPLLNTRFVRAELARLAAPRRPGWPQSKGDARA
jgi:hypothetical protein